MISVSGIPPARSIPQRYTKMCVLSHHNSAEMVIIMWCQIIKFSPAPNNTFAQSELELFYIHRLSRSYGIKKLLRCSQPCHAQLLTVTIRVIWLVGFSVEVVLPSLVQ